MGAVDACLRLVTLALLQGSETAAASAAADALRGTVPDDDDEEEEGEGGGGGSRRLADGWSAYEDEEGRPYYWNDESGEMCLSAPTRQLDACVAYLRDRVGVPRDMGAAAAASLRAHLTWAIDVLRGVE